MLKEFRPLLQNKQFLALWISQLLSQLTIHIMNYLLIVTLFSRTQSPLATSLLWVAYALPAIVIGPIAAAVVDRTELKKMLMITNLIQAVVIAFFALLSSQRIFFVYLFAMTYSFINQFYVPSEFAMLPSIVKKRDYPQANGLFFLTQHSAIIVGFAMSGFINSSFGFDQSLIFCSIMLFLAFISVTFLDDVPQISKTKKFETLLFGFFANIKEGYEFIKNKPSVYIPFISLMTIQILSTTVILNAPVLSTQIFDINLDWAGIVIAAPAGIGALAGALVFPRLIKQGMRKYISIQLSLAMSTVSFYFVAFVAPFIEQPIRIVIGLVAITIVGFGFVGAFIPLQTQLQEVTPGGLRGRVFGNFWFLVTIATIFPVVFSGAITEILGIRVLYTLIGTVLGIGYIFVRRYSNYVISSFRKNREKF